MPQRQDKEASPLKVLVSSLACIPSGGCRYSGGRQNRARKKSSAIGASVPARDRGGTVWQGHPDRIRRHRVEQLVAEMTLLPETCGSLRWGCEPAARKSGTLQPTG